MVTSSHEKKKKSDTKSKNTHFIIVFQPHARALSNRWVNEEIVTS